MSPVAITGFPTQMYHATHCFSAQLKDAISVPPYSVSYRGAEAPTVALNDILRSMVVEVKKPLSCKEWVDSIFTSTNSGSRGDSRGA